MIIRRTTVLIGADERVSTEDLTGLLRGHDFNVLGTAADGWQLVEAARQLKPDVIVAGESLSGLSARGVLQALAALNMDTRVIVLAAHNDSEAATEALRAGAAAFLLEDSIGQELIHAIRLVAQGHVYVAAAVSDAVMAGMGAIDDALELTGYQREVLFLTPKGRSLHEIADLIRLAIEQRPRLH